MAPSPYNPLKKQNDLRSHGVCAQLRPRPLKRTPKYSVDPVYASAIFLFGLAFGSFLNVCIHRLPLGLSVVTPRSACPGCKRPIAFYDNLPVVSWLLLRGRCRNCQSRISHRVTFLLSC